MAGPHPVVRFATKLTYARRRCGHHANIAIHLIVEEVVLVAGVEGEGLGADARLALEVALLQLLVGDVSQETVGHGIRFAHLASLDALVHQVGDINDAVYKAELQSGSRYFLFAGHGPETVSQVVVLHATVLLNSAIATVVVGQDQSFGRDDFAGASTAKDTHGILQTHAVRVVERVSFQFQTLLFHQVNRVLLLHQLEQPHAFVGTCRQGGKGDQAKHQALFKEMFHRHVICYFYLF